MLSWMLEKGEIHREHLAGVKITPPGEGERSPDQGEGLPQALGVNCLSDGDSPRDLGLG